MKFKHNNAKTANYNIFKIGTPLRFVQEDQFFLMDKTTLFSIGFNSFEAALEADTKPLIEFQARVCFSKYSTHNFLLSHKKIFFRNFYGTKQKKVLKAIFRSISMQIDSFLRKSNCFAYFNFKITKIP